MFFKFLFVILAGPAQASCPDLLRPWISLGPVRVQSLPIADLLEHGIAHVPVHPHLLLQAASMEFAFHDYVRAQLTDYWILDPSATHVTAETRSPAQDFEWHRYAIQDRWLTPEDMANGPPRRFHLRATIPLDSENQPPTVVRLIGKDQALQGRPNELTLYIADIIEHTAPIRPAAAAKNRRLLVIDAVAIRRRDASSHVPKGWKDLEGL